MTSDEQAALNRMEQMIGSLLKRPTTSDVQSSVATALIQSMRNFKAIVGGTVMISLACSAMAWQLFILQEKTAQIRLETIEHIKILTQWQNSVDADRRNLFTSHHYDAAAIIFNRKKPAVPLPYFTEVEREVK